MPERLSRFVTHELNEIAGAFLDAPPADTSQIPEKDRIAGFRREAADALARCRHLKEVMPEKENAKGGAVAEATSKLLDLAIQRLSDKKKQKGLDALNYSLYLNQTLAPFRAQALARDLSTQPHGPGGASAYYNDDGPAAGEPKPRRRITIPGVTKPSVSGDGRANQPNR